MALKGLTGQWLVCVNLHCPRTGGEESRLGTSPVKKNNPVAEGEQQEISENKVTESKQNQFPGKKNKKKRKKKQQQGKGPHPQHINKSLLEKVCKMLQFLKIY